MIQPDDMDELAKAARSPLRKYADNYPGPAIARRSNGRPPAKQGVNGVVIFCSIVGVIVVYGLASLINSQTGRNGAATYITGTQLIDEYIANEVAADSRYRGHAVQVTGKIGSIHRDILDKAYVTLDGHAFRSVQCLFDKSDEAELTSLSEGQTVAIRGVCNGLFGNVIVKDCVIASR